MASLSLLLPTRGRPKLLLRFLDSVLATAKDPSTLEIVLAIDDDDPSYDNLPLPPLNIITLKGKKASMGVLNTRCFKASSGKLVMLANDDLIMKTPHWDSILLQTASSYPDGIFLLHVHDGMKNGSFPCFPILSRFCLDLLEDPFPEIYAGDGIDTHIDDIFRRLRDLGHSRMHYIPQIQMEHLHIGNGKAALDETYQARSHRQGTRAFHSLWKEREQLAKKLAVFLSQREIISCSNFSGKVGNPFLNLFLAFLTTKQSFSYRIRYGFYHFFREMYLALKLHRLKRFYLHRS